MPEESEKETPTTLAAVSTPRSAESCDDLEILKEQLALHRVVDPAGYDKAMEAARRSLDVATQTAKLSLVRRVGEAAKQVEVDSTGGIADLARAHQSLTNAEVAGKGGVVANQVNVHIGVDPDDIV